MNNEKHLQQGQDWNSSDTNQKLLSYPLLITTCDIRKINRNPGPNAIRTLEIIKWEHF